MEQDARTATKTKPKHEVSVLYNGVTKEIGFKPVETVDRLLKQSIRRFGVVDNQHLLSLFNAAGAELPDGSDLGAVGVETGDTLVLRPGVVKGG